MKEKYRKYASLILTTIFFVQLTQTTYAQESLSADTPFIEVNGKTIKNLVVQLLHFQKLDKII